MPGRFWPLLGLALLLTACTAPGMKLNTKPSDPPRTTEVEGLSVTLRPLNGQTLQALLTEWQAGLHPAHQTKPTLEETT